MPEGPTIKGVADRLRTALEGAVVRGFSSRFKKAAVEGWQTRIEGQRVTGVWSHGKNLFIEFSSGEVLYSHMLMWGAWHVYRVDEPWRKEERKARVILTTDQHVAVLFSAPVCELIPREALATHKTAGIGPDLLAEAFDSGEARRRFFAEENREREVGELIMDQTVLAGIGNILKSEILFQAGIHPQRRVSTITPDEFERLITVSRDLMRTSYEIGGFKGAFLPPDAPVESGKFGYVYRRRSYPCLRCSTPIKMVRQGEMQRMSYYCPHCQPYIGADNPDLVPPTPTRKRRGE